MVVVLDPNGGGTLHPLTKVIRTAVYPFVPSTELVCLGERNFFEPIIGVVWVEKVGRFDAVTPHYVASAGENGYMDGEKVSVIVQDLIRAHGWEQEAPLDGSELL